MRPFSPAVRLLRPALLLGLILAAAGPVAAQRVSGGLAAGAGVFTIGGGREADFSPRTAFGARVWAEREVRPGWAVGTGLAYFAKGAEERSTVGEVFPGEPEPERGIRLLRDYTYLEVPLTLAYAPPVRTRLRPQLYAGPHVSFLQDAYLSVGLEGGSLGTPEPDESVRSVDGGLTAGLLVRTDAGQFGDLAAGVHLSLGLGNLRETTPALTTRGAFFWLGVAF